MVTPTDLRSTAPQSQIRTALKRQDLWGLAVLIAVVWGSSQAWSTWKTASLSAQLKGKAHGGDILMITTSTCPYCAAAKAWMDAHDVVYRDCNVEADTACDALYAARGSPGVPLMRVKDRWQLGFDPQWLVAMLAEARHPSKAQP